jgi:hypothetical protein
MLLSYYSYYYYYLTNAPVTIATGRKQTYLFKKESRTTKILQLNIFAKTMKMSAIDYCVQEDKRKKITNVETLSLNVTITYFYRRH